MKKLLLGLLLLPLTTMADITSSNYKHDYDRFTQKDSYFWRSEPKFVDTSSGIYTMTVGFVIEKTPSENSFSNLFVFNHVSGEPYDFSDCSNDWLVDGEILKPISQDGTNGDELDNNDSMLWNEFSEEQLKSIIQAKVAEYRICNNEFIVDKEQLEGLKHMYAEYQKK